jgi:hypothetical protein
MLAYWLGVEVSINMQRGPCSQNRDLFAPKEECAFLSRLCLVIRYSIFLTGACIPVELVLRVWTGLS